MTLLSWYFQRIYTLCAVLHSSINCDVPVVSLVSIHFYGIGYCNKDLTFHRVVKVDLVVIDYKWNQQWHNWLAFFFFLSDELPNRTFFWLIVYCGIHCKKKTDAILLSAWMYTENGFLIGTVSNRKSIVPFHPL